MVQESSIIHIHYIDLYGHALASESLPHRVMKFTILVDPSLVNLTIYLVCLIYAWEKGKENFKEIMRFHYMTYISHPSTRTPASRVMKFWQTLLWSTLYKYWLHERVTWKLSTRENQCQPRLRLGRHCYPLVQSIFI